MKKNILKAALTVFFAFIALEACAQDSYKGSWYALPGVSYVNVGSDLKSDDGAGVSFRVGKQLDQNWDIQFGGTYAKGGKYKQTLIGVDALYVLDRSTLSPFLMAGVGAAQNDASETIPGSGSNTSWMINVGAGVQYAFSDRIGFQADVRRVLSEVKNVQDSVGNTYVNLAMIINFDVPKANVDVEKPTQTPVIETPKAVVPAQTEYQSSAVVEEEKPVVKLVESAAEVCQPKFEKITVSAEALFAFNKKVIKSQGRHVLDAAADKLKANLDIEMVLVTGHSDKIGKQKYNQKLSVLRAKVVKAYLISKGVDASRLKTQGKGESEQVVTCDGMKGKKLIECLQPNRRVVLSAEKQRESACK